MAENYHDLVANIIKSYQKMGCKMSLNIHFFNSYLDFFSPNLGLMNTLSDSTRIFCVWKNGIKESVATC